MSFVRQGEDVDDDLVILINFDPASYESFRVGVPREGDWEVIFDSDVPSLVAADTPVRSPTLARASPIPGTGRWTPLR